MTRPHPQRSQLAAPVVLVYWLMVLGGLSVFTMTRVDNVADIVPLWVGAIGGTLLGQCLALHDFRLWVAALVTCFAGLYCGPLVPAGDASSQLWLAFIPAALCGFWSLGDRPALAALWFPAVLWMLAILDRNEQQLAPDGVAAVLLGGLALLFVWFLHARESRRVGLWRTISPETLAPIRPPELLREPPGRQLARIAWGLSLGAIAITLTVWLAPPLWRTETLGGEPIEVAAAPVEGLPCCPLHQRIDTESSRVKEYLDLGLGHDLHTTTPRENIDCRVCEPVVITAPPVDGIVEGTAGGTGEAPGTVVAEGVATEPAAAGTTAWPEPVPSIDPAPLPPTPTTVASSEPAMPSTQPPLPESPPPPPAPPTTPAEPPPPAPSSAAPALSPPPAGGVAPAAPPHRSAADGAGPALLRWLAFAAIAGVMFQLVRLVLRPLRRLVTLRHLRRPFWDETVDQRVSNLWQLALIGLRDAGWRAGVTEAPGQLARRVHIDGLERCAAILERARHGVGIDPGDLAEMGSAADLAYRAARSDAGGFARAISWLRWPLT